MVWVWCCGLLELLGFYWFCCWFVCLLDCLLFGFIVDCVGVLVVLVIWFGVDGLQSLICVDCWCGLFVCWFGCCVGMFDFWRTFTYLRVLVCSCFSLVDWYFTWFCSNWYDLVCFLMWFTCWFVFVRFGWLWGCWCLGLFCFVNVLGGWWVWLFWLILIWWFCLIGLGLCRCCVVGIAFYCLVWGCCVLLCWFYL